MTLPRPVAASCILVALALGPRAVAEPAASRAPDTNAPAVSPAPDTNADAPEVVQARKLFLQGVDLVKAAQWAGALAAFEKSEAIKPHATTTFNIAACERAMGRYTRARLHLASALSRNRDNPGELAPSLEQEAEGLMHQIDGILARVDIQLDPRSAAISVDGSPLHAVQRAKGTVYVAGIEKPGRGRVLGPAKFRAELDPGAHVITLSRKGYTDAVVNRVFAPGSTTALPLVLARLPATLDISSNVRGALVTVNHRDLGPVPVTVRRLAGTYRVVVSKEGYEPYEAQVLVHAGEHSNLRARLVEEKIPITKRWWFWTGAAVVVAGGAAATYALTRPAPSPPPYDGGTTGWVVKPTGYRF